VSTIPRFLRRKRGGVARILVLLLLFVPRSQQTSSPEALRPIIAGNAQEASSRAACPAWAQVHSSQRVSAGDVFIRQSPDKL
jgi:hypothetical protein